MRFWVKCFPFFLWSVSLIFLGSNKPNSIFFCQSRDLMSVNYICLPLCHHKFVYHDILQGQGRWCMVIFCRIVGAFFFFKTLSSQNIWLHSAFCIARIEIGVNQCVRQIVLDLVFHQVWGFAGGFLWLFAFGIGFGVFFFLTLICSIWFMRQCDANGVVCKGSVIALLRCSKAIIFLSRRSNCKNVSQDPTNQMRYAFASMAIWYQGIIPPHC